MSNLLKSGRTAFLLIATVTLANCGGGGGSSSPTQFAQEIGVAPAPTPTPTPTATATQAPVALTYPSYFVDYQNGDDNADGRSKGNAWKHAPGDPNASGVAASAVLAPGDHLVFVAGSRYFGSIKADWSGAAGNPIVIEGEGDKQLAVIDGSSQAATLTPCPSQAACAGVAAWRSVHIATFADALPEHAQLFVGGNTLMPAQWPDPKDLFYSDEPEDMASESGAALNSGRASLPSNLADLLASPDGAKIAVWVTSNRIEERALSQVKSGTAIFDATGVSAYTDRTASFAIRGHSALINKAGEFAILPDRKTALVMLPAAASTLYAATGRNGIDLSGASNVVVRGLSFENMADIEGNVRTGMPIWAMRAPASNITIENNRFANLVMTNQMGAITMWKTTNLMVRANSFHTVVEGSAVRVLNSTNATVRENVVERLSGTALTFMNTTDSIMALNRIRDVLGVHGNGISIYLGNQRTKILANTISEAKRPMTIKGNAAASPAAEDLLIANNLFVATGDSVGSLLSWGDNFNGVKIVNNVILGGAKGALKLHNADRKLTVEGNVIAGMAFAEAYPADWSVAANLFTKLGPFQSKLTPVDAVTKALALETTAAGNLPTSLSQFCPYVTDFVDYTFLGSSYGRLIGANFSCS